MVQLRTNHGVFQVLDPTDVDILLSDLQIIGKMSIIGMSNVQSVYEKDKVE